MNLELLLTTSICPRLILLQPETPCLGVVKVNFDGAKLNGWGRGWGDVGRDSGGGILFSSVQQGSGFKGVELEELNACLFASQCACDLARGRSSSKATVWVSHRSCSLVLFEYLFGFVLDSILGLASCFVFCNFSHARRTGNRVAHSLAHLQPFNASCRTSGWPRSVTPIWHYKSSVRINGISADYSLFYSLHCIVTKG